MKKVLTVFFVTLGVIFFILILVGTYFFVTDPLELRPLLFGTNETEQLEGTTETDKNPLLSEEQEQALETFGIDPASVPSEITPEQEQCFEAELGEERVDEIRAGASPKPTEFFKTEHCL